MPSRGACPASKRGACSDERAAQFLSFIRDPDPSVEWEYLHRPVSKSRFALFDNHKTWPSTFLASSPQVLEISPASRCWRFSRERGIICDPHRQTLSDRLFRITQQRGCPGCGAERFVQCIPQLGTI